MEHRRGVIPRASTTDKMKKRKENVVLREKPRTKRERRERDEQRKNPTTSLFPLILFSCFSLSPFLLFLNQILKNATGRREAREDRLGQAHGLLRVRDHLLGKILIFFLFFVHPPRKKKKERPFRRFLLSPLFFSPLPSPPHSRGRSFPLCSFTLLRTLSRPIKTSKPFIKTSKKQKKI